MSIKHVYEAPEAEALTFCQEVNFCGTIEPSVTVTYGDGDDDEFFGDETDW